MVKLYTEAPDVNSQAPKLIASGGNPGAARAVDIAGDALTFMVGKHQELKRKRALGEVSNAYDQLGIEMMDKYRADNGMPPLQESDKEILHGINRKFQKYKSAERQRQGVSDYSTRALVLKKELKAKYPGLILEIDQLAQQNTGMNTGQMVQNVIASPYEDKANAAYQEFLGPDYAQNAKDAIHEAVAQYAVNAGMSPDAPYEDMVQRFKAEQPERFNQIQESQRMSIEAQRFGLLSTKEQLKQLLNPAYNAEQNLVGVVTQWHDSMYPSERSVPLQVKRERYGRFLNKERITREQDAELVQHRKRMELDPGYRASVLMRQGVEETYAKYSSEIDTSDTPYTKKYEFVMRNYKPEWEATVLGKERMAGDSWRNRTPESQAYNDMLSKAYMLYATTTGGDPSLANRKDILDLWANVEASKKRQQLVQEQFNANALRAQNQEQFDKAQFQARRQTVIGSIIPEMQARASAMAIELLNNGVGDEALRVRHAEALKLFRVNSRSSVFSGPNADLIDDDAVKEQLKILDETFDIADEILSGKMEDSQKKIAEDKLSFFRALSDHRAESQVINPQADVNSQITNRDLERIIGRIKVLADPNFDGTQVDTGRELVETSINLAVPNTPFLTGDVDRRTQFSDLAPAYNTAVSRIIHAAGNKAFTPEQRRDAVLTAVNNFVVLDYAQLTSNGKDLDADVLENLGGTALKLLENPEVQQVASSDPEVYAALQSVSSMFSDRVIEGFQEAFQDEMNKAFGRYNVVLPPTPNNVGVIYQGRLTNFIKQTIDQYGNVTFYPAATTEKELAATVKRITKDNLSSTDAIQLFRELQTTASDMNRRFSSSFKRLGNIRAGYTGLPPKEAIQGLMEGQGLFDEAPKEDSTKKQ